MGREVNTETKISLLSKLIHKNLFILGMLVSAIIILPATIYRDHVQTELIDVQRKSLSNYIELSEEIVTQLMNDDINKSEVASTPVIPAYDLLAWIEGSQFVVDGVIADDTIRNYCDDEACFKAIYSLSETYLSYRKHPSALLAQ